MTGGLQAAHTAVGRRIESSREYDHEFDESEDDAAGMAPMSDAEREA